MVNISFLQTEKTRILDFEKGITPEETKEYLRNLESILLKRHMEGETGRTIIEAYTHGIDIFLQAIYQHIRGSIDPGYKNGIEIALVAMGGYGRRELNPRSDIDLMLLYPSRMFHEVEEISKRFLYTLWDTGLDIGFSVRSIKESLNLVKYDHKTMTSLLDSRLLAGEGWIYMRLMERFRKKIISGCRDEFIKEKLDENRKRHKKYGESIYILEPNVKEGKGGLRDIHSALWIAKLKKGVNSLEDLVQDKMLSEEEGREIKTSLDYILRIRNDLHFNSRRRVDQLTFDAQERISRLFGYRDIESSLGVERFMRDYYIHAKRINSCSNSIILRLTYSPRKGLVDRLRLSKLGDTYQILKGMITLSDEKLLKKDPLLIMKAFEYAHKYSLNIHPLTMETLARNLHLIDDAFRRSHEVNRIFLQIIRSKKGIYETLTKMHSIGLLGRYIPEFEDITCKVQHDLYHIYTVDVHSLFAIRELESLVVDGEYKRKFPLLSSLLDGIERFDLLLLSVLFHDIGKVGGRGHAERGRGIVRRITERMGLSVEERSVIMFLVENHLLLANLAQYRDIHDLKLVINFARAVRDLKNLDMLYLLTFADVRAVGQDVWNQWKAALFQELYFRTRKVLEKGTFELPGVKEELNKIRKKMERLVPAYIPEDKVYKYMKRFPPRYYLSNSPENIALHLRIIEELDGKNLITNIRHDLERVYTEVIICTYDTHGLFSHIAGVMAANNVNILGAQINTSRDGIALDILHVNSSIGEIVRDNGKWDKIKRELKGVLEGTLRVEELVRSRKPSIIDKNNKPIVQTRVEIDNEVSDEFTIIDVYAQDRIGLLYDITRTLTSLDIYIYLARISTKGNEAADVFYVKDIFGHKIGDEKKLKGLRDSLIAIFREDR